MSESHLYIGAAVLCAGAAVCAFVICAFSLVANRDNDDQQEAQGEPSQGRAAGERSDLHP